MVVEAEAARRARRILVWKAVWFHCGSRCRTAPAAGLGAQTREQGRPALTQMSTHSKLRSLSPRWKLGPGRRVGGLFIIGTASQRSHNQSQVRAEAVSQGHRCWCPRGQALRSEPSPSPTEGGRKESRLCKPATSIAPLSAQAFLSQLVSPFVSQLVPQG